MAHMVKVSPSAGVRVLARPGCPPPKSWPPRERGRSTPAAPCPGKPIKPTAGHLSTDGERIAADHGSHRVPGWAWIAARRAAPAPTPALNPWAPVLGRQHLHGRQPGPAVTAGRHRQATHGCLSAGAGGPPGRRAGHSGFPHRSVPGTRRPAGPRPHPALIFACTTARQRPSSATDPPPPRARPGCPRHCG